MTDGRDPAVPVVELRGVSRWFSPQTAALADVTAQFDRGRSVALRGVSGSGKTTLLSILGLLDTPSAGTYVLDGELTAQMNEHERTQARQRHLSFVFQAFHLVPHLTSVENVEEALRIAGVGRSERAARARDALRSVGLGHRLAAFPATLSGGEQQRVAVARAIARTPRLLLCDEPTGNLDSRNSESVMGAILGACATGTCVVIATHDERVAEQCDNEVHIVDGRIEHVR